MYNRLAVEKDVLANHCASHLSPLLYMRVCFVALWFKAPVVRGDGPGRAVLLILVCYVGRYLLRLQVCFHIHSTVYELIFVEATGSDRLSSDIPKYGLPVQG